MSTRLLFNASAIVEVLTGLALLFAPEFVIALLLGDGLGQTGVAATRVLSVGLFSLGISTWESAPLPARTRIGLCTYNIGVAALLAMLGLSGAADGLLLWPTVGLHALIGATMLWVMASSTNSNGFADKREDSHQ